MPAAPEQRIVLTRSAEDCKAWAQRLEALGLVPIAYPCISTEPIDSPGLRAALAAGAAYAEWLILTSRRGVEATRRLLDGGPPESLKIAVVGPATAAAAKRAFGRVDLVGTGTAAALGDVLAAALPSTEWATPVLLAVAANAGNTIAERLAGRVVLQRVDVYQTVPCRPAETKQALSGLAAHAVLFASPSAVTGFVNRTDIDVDTPFVTIGAATSNAVRRHGLTVAAEAARPNLEGLLEAL